MSFVGMLDVLLTWRYWQFRIILHLLLILLSSKSTILFLRIDKLCIRTNPVMKVVVTDNWIIMVGQWPWNLHLAHQSDVELKIVKTDQHQLSTDGQAGGSQYLSILVKNRRANLESFTFRWVMPKMLEFKLWQLKVDEGFIISFKLFIFSGLIR